MNFGIKDPIIYANKLEQYHKQLKPCPFCGAHPEIVVCGTCNDLMYVRCYGCNAAPYSATPIYESQNMWDKCFGLLVRQWNRRLTGNERKG